MHNDSKLCYLNEAIVGPAVGVIHGVATDGSKYDEAIKILLERYEKPEAIQDHHVHSIMKIPAVKESDEATGLQTFYDYCKKHIRGLELTGNEKKSFEPWIEPWLTSALPDSIHREYNCMTQEKRFSSDDLLAFVEKKIDGWKRTDQQRRNFTNDTRKVKSVDKPPMSNRSEALTSDKIITAAALPTSFYGCSFCSDSGHTPFRCPLDVEKRKEACKKQNRCFRCSKRGHTGKECMNKKKCFRCQGNHHTWLCDQPPQTAAENVTSEITPQVRSTTVAIKNAVSAMQTVYVKLMGPEKSVVVRCFLDTGSETSFVSKTLVDKLKLKSESRGKVDFRAFSSDVPKRCEVQAAHLTLYHPMNWKICVPINTLVVPFITRIPIRQPTENLRAVLEKNNVVLSYDPGDNDDVDDEVHLMIGIDEYWKIATGMTKIITKELRAVHTQFGWTLAGKSDEMIEKNDPYDSLRINTVILREDTNDILKKFWELDVLGITPTNEKEDATERKVEENFEKNVEYKDGRYAVGLPWKKDRGDLDDNKAVALRRFWTLVRKMKADDDLRTRYTTVVDEQLKNGILEEVKEEQDDKSVYYLPHRPVIKENRDTTKLRIVFDASSRNRGCLSLNDCLHTGPNHLPQIVDMINEFRKNTIAVTADIKQAFHQIYVKDDDRDVLRFFWTQTEWDGRERVEPRVLRSTRVMFGTTASPYLLNATVKHHLNTTEKRYEATRERLNNRMYVDDYIDSLRDDATAIKTYKEAKEILSTAGMELVKWNSNSEIVRKYILSNESTSECPVETKVLGLRWNTSSDTLRLELEEVHAQAKQEKWTKRKLVQLTASIFDPMGYVSPFLVSAKLLFQDTWKSRISWDASLPAEVSAKWEKWKSQLRILDEIEIKRPIHESPKEILEEELHVFCDASQQAYGLVAYLRVTDNRNSITTTFLTSKSRIAPIKELTIPRLELMAALLAARYVGNSKQQTGKITLWSDSQIVLWWIHNSEKHQKPFVAHRVKEITALTEKSRWRHCPGEQNPADLITRGLDASKLRDSKLWWEGPKWLRQNENKWPIENVTPPIQETKLGVATVTTKKTNEPIFETEKISRINKIFRITAWVMRFIKKTRKLTCSNGAITTEELREAESYWIRQIQQKTYGEEIASLENKQKINKHSNIYQFRPQMDNEGMMRISSRLKFADIEEESKNPIILPAEEYVTQLILRETHEITRHGGVTITLAELKKRFFVPKARTMIKKILKTCVVCQKINKRLLTETTGLLPPERLTPGTPFETTGVDFAGPLYLKKGEKVYIALFTCATTRAIHLELVSNLTTEVFILALRRFFARRAIPIRFYSDNARTFKRADKELQILHEIASYDIFQEFLTSKRISWNYIVETAPWWGGFWERLVRNTKTCLKKTLNRSTLNYEELNTFLTEAEAVINSRPLTYVYGNPEEPEPLTPAHFLMGKTPITLPEKVKFDAQLEDPNRLEISKLWKHRQTLIQNFWKRWTKEYILDLRTFHSKPSSREVKAGDIALIEDASRSRLLWRLGLITEARKGRDSKVRDCVLKLPDQTLLHRPIQRLCLLELPDPPSQVAGGSVENDDATESSAMESRQSR